MEGAAPMDQANSLSVREVHNTSVSGRWWVAPGPGFTNDLKSKDGLISGLKLRRVSRTSLAVKVGFTKLLKYFPLFCERT